MQHFHKNPRQIIKTQMSDLKASMEQLGDLSGITHDLDTDELLTGNQRCEALPGVMSGLIQPEITQKFDPPLEDGTALLGYFLIDGRRFNYRAVRGWDNKRRDLANLRANKMGGFWDWDIMANEFDVETLLDSGFTDEELTGADFEVEQEAPEPQIDRAEELREKWGVELGQLWQIGEHRIICGDCTDVAVVDRLMGGEKADMVFTDPPYNVGKDYGEYTDDNMGGSEYKTWCISWFDICKSNSHSVALTPGAVNVWMWAEIERPKWMAIWIKRNQVSRNRAGGFNAYEPILCYGKMKINYDVWDIPVKHDQIDSLHPVPKTLEAWQKILEDLLGTGEIVLDPLLGSGTTLVACERLNRKGRGIEISPAYTAVCLQRLADMKLEPKLID